MLGTGKRCLQYLRCPLDREEIVASMASTEDQAGTAAAGAQDSTLNTMSEKTGQNGAPTANGQPNGPAEQGKQEPENEKGKDGGDAKPKDEKQPEGGYDSTPIPSRPAGYTLKFTFHRASNLPMGDVNTMSSDPYISAQLNTDTPSRHREDPFLRFRTPTVRRNTNPEWNEEWIVANVPSSGFKLKLHICDEDPADQDDMLGGVHITVPSLNENWAGIKNEAYKIKAHGGSKRAYLLQILTTCFREDKHLRGELVASVEMLGRTPEDGQHGRLYTVGPCHWIRHYSPVLGRLVNMKEPDGADDAQPSPNDNKTKKQKAERYNFQANQVQLQGPIPAELYHRFVEFKPWVKRMFTSSGLSGMVLGKALHHQHNRVYNFGRSTEWGYYPQGPCEEMTKKFLDLVHYDQGGRIFTYVLTLDALWRFTETGKEFGIDMLSKHTMHSDVSIYIAFSGEFFIRRLKHSHRPPPPDPAEETSQSHPPEHQANESHPPHDISGGPPDDEPPKEPQYYELVIDNDSGTYRPNAKMLPVLKDFLARSLPGLHILTLDCQADEERMGRMKNEQRERKKAEGDHIVYAQGDRSSISSSDEEELDTVQAGMSDANAPNREHGVLGQYTKDAKLKQKAKMDRIKRQYGGRDESAAEAVGNPSGNAA